MKNQGNTSEIFQIHAKKKREKRKKTRREKKIIIIRGKRLYLADRIEKQKAGSRVPG